MRVPILTELEIEERAYDLLFDFNQHTGECLAAPVPIERIVDEVLDLPILWESIPSQGALQIVSKLSQPTLTSSPRITLNEDLRDSMFKEFPGLDRTALAHEAGHAVFHVEWSRSQQLTLEIDAPATFISQHEVFTKQMDELLNRIGPKGDDWWREWQAHTFMRFILMPRMLLLPALEAVNYRSWPGLYKLRSQFGVTISALVVHLTSLRIIKVDKHNHILDNSPRAQGQISLDT